MEKNRYEVDSADFLSQFESKSFLDGMMDMWGFPYVCERREPIKFDKDIYAEKHEKPKSTTIEDEYRALAEEHQKIAEIIKYCFDEGVKRFEREYNVR